MLKAGDFRNREITVIYIAGYGRSGSTLLDVVLSNVDGIRSLGEVVNYYAMCSDQECPPVLNKGFWGEVREKVLSCLPFSVNEVEAFSNANHVLRKFERFRSGWRLFLPLGRDAFMSYRQVVDCLFYSIFDASKGDMVFIDSSKTAWLSSWRPYCLHRVGYKVKMIHLVRDGRGVIGSFLKGDNVKMQEGLDDVSFRAPVTRSIFGWLFANLSAFLNSQRIPDGDSYLLRYEDLISNTQHVLAELGTFLDIDLSQVASRIANNCALEVKGGGFSGNRLIKEDSIVINTGSAMSPALKLLHSLYYWVVAGWLHKLIYYRDGR